MRTLPFALMLLTLSSPALAEDRREPPTTEQLRERVDHKLDQVGATAEQRETIHALVGAAAEQREAFKVEGTTLRTRLRDLLWTEEIDHKALEKVREQAVDLFDKTTRFGLDHLVQVAEVLTPEQRVQVHDQLTK